MKKILISLLSLIFSGTLISYSQNITDTIPATKIVNTIKKRPICRLWKVVELRGSNTTFDKVESDNLFTINFAPLDGAISGTASCNSYFGSYDTGVKNKIRIYGIGSTMLSCPTIGTENFFFKSLNTVTRYNILPNGNLELYKRHKLVAVLRPYDLSNYNYNKNSNFVKSEYQGKFESTLPSKDYDGVEAILYIHSNSTYKLELRSINNNFKDIIEGSYGVIGNELMINKLNWKFLISKNALTLIEGGNSDFECSPSIMFVFNKVK